MDKQIYEKVRKEVVAKLGEDADDAKIEEATMEAIDIIVNQNNEYNKAIMRAKELSKDTKIAEEFRSIRLQHGIAPAMALFKCIIQNTPLLSDERRAHYLRSIKTPDGISVDATCGAKLKFADDNGSHIEFEISCTGVDPEMDFVTESQEVNLLAKSEEQKKELIECFSLLFNQARFAFIELLSINDSIVSSVGRKFSEACGVSSPVVDFTNMHLSSANNTIYLRMPKEMYDNAVPPKLPVAMGFVIKKLD